jgi:hypothetical protein
MSDGQVVALVDDDVGVLDSLKFLLEAAGYTVDAYGSAMAFLADGARVPACLIVDQHMPSMSGLKLIAPATGGQEHSGSDGHRLDLGSNDRGGETTGSRSAGEAARRSGFADFHQRLFVMMRTGCDTAKALRTT